MISFTANSSASTTTSFLGAHSQPSISARPSQYRPIRVSASYASSTVERPSAKSLNGLDYSLYEVLGIRMEATCQEIKTAYRKLARVVHPDVASPANDSAADEFIRIHEAYSTLSDPGKRADYDRALFGRQWSTGATTLRSGYGSYATSYNSNSSYSKPRSWETDQCW